MILGAKLRESEHKFRHFCLPVLTPAHLSLRMEKLGKYWTDIHEIWYLKTFRKFCREKLKYCKTLQE
jgi:hypothetical protein